MKYIITDGSKYVARNPYQANKYYQADCLDLATKFTSKQAKRILGSKNRDMKWIKSGFYIQEFDGSNTGNVMSRRESKRRSNGNCFKDFEWDKSILNDIEAEERAIVGLLAYDYEELSQKKFEMEQSLSYTDSAISDILHAIEGKKINAAKRAVIVGYLKTMRELHTQIKKCIRYVEVMQESINNKEDIGTLKKKLQSSEPNEYVGRTKYYELIQNIIG